MNKEAKQVQVPKPDVRPAQMKSKREDKKPYERPALKLHGSVEKVTGFTF